MEHGYVKVAALTPKVKVADPVYNGGVICEKIDEAIEAGADIMVFPELCITGYTCGDLFWQELLIRRAAEQMVRIAAHTKGKNGIVFAGLPFSYQGKLYNVAAAMSDGKVLGLVPKTYLPNYNEFYEARYFTSGMKETVNAGYFECYDVLSEMFIEYAVYMGSDMVFPCTTMPELRIGVEICEDLWVPNPPSISHAMAGATVIVNLSASNEVTGKDVYRKDLVAGQSARLICGYVYADAGDGESTQDLVYASHNIIAENGLVLAESKRFLNEPAYGEIDVQKMVSERRRMSTYGITIPNFFKGKLYSEFPFFLKVRETKLSRHIDPTPFVPRHKGDKEKRCEEILSIQSEGLKKRLEHTNCTCAVVGISGGLDSTLALLVTARAFDRLGLDRSGIIGVTMPGFGTTDRTHGNAVKLIAQLRATFLEVDIQEAVRVHFRDIGQDENLHDVTYENAQARERTQILMDLANKDNGIVIGTGDMSELALGWATYNGDHMSMYGVNSSVPKTLVRHLVRYFANTCGEKDLSTVLYDVLDTPVSPELLPPNEGRIAQITEDIVGPYELHDFFLYYILRFGFPPKKIVRLAKIAFVDHYDEADILKWMKVFYQRFFSQQFKRSCLPDGPKVGSVAVSPRGDLRMPSDASAGIWLKELEEMG